MSRVITDSPNHVVRFFQEKEQEVLSILRDRIMHLPSALNALENRFLLGRFFEILLPKHFTYEKNPSRYFSHKPIEGTDVYYQEGRYRCGISVKVQEKIFPRPHTKNPQRLTKGQYLTIKNSRGNDNDLSIRNFDYLLAIQRDKRGFGFGLASFNTVDVYKKLTKDGVQSRIPYLEWLILSDLHSLREDEWVNPSDLNQAFYEGMDFTNELIMGVPCQSDYTTQTALRERSAI